MSGNFEERFKGKISRMDKTGLNALIVNNQAPVTKQSHTGFASQEEYSRPETLLDDRRNAAQPNPFKSNESQGQGGVPITQSGSPVPKSRHKASSSKDPGEVTPVNEITAKKGNYSGIVSQKNTVMNEAGSKALKAEADKRYRSNPNDSRQGELDDARKHANTAPTNNYKSGLKNSGQFQSNAMMMMAPFPMGPGGQPMSMMAAMPMYQPIAVQTGSGIQMMHPGFYPQTPMNIGAIPYQMLGAPGYPVKPGSEVHSPAQFNYMSNQYVMGSKSANNYYPQNQGQAHSELNHRHGMTEQGNFNVGTAKDRKTWESTSRRSQPASTKANGSSHLTPLTTTKV